MNLARKYRPKVLSDLVGQPAVTRILGNAIKRGRLQQCYLLVGQYGSGKTSAARLLAAMENCLETPGTDPCGKCDNCKKIFVGKHTDVEEIDAASGAGKVEQVRKLKIDALYSPIDGCKVKYIIIDECHRMSAASNDSLLKLFEEPPANVRFILCTTDIQKMRPAIQSRCQRHDFKKIYWSQIAERLREVAKLEKLTIEEGAINICAKLAHGSMRDALQNLEKLIDWPKDDDKMTTDVAQEVFGAVDDLLFYNLFDQIIGDQKGKFDASTGFGILNQMLQTGCEFEVIYQSLADHLRNILVMLTASKDKAEDFIGVSSTGKERLKSQVVLCQKGAKIKAVFKVMHALNKAKDSVTHNIPEDIALQTWFVESVVFFREKGG